MCSRYLNFGIVSFNCLFNGFLSQLQELQRQVEHATFDSLSNDLHDDMKKVERFVKDRSNDEACWVARVQAHKRIRRAKGLQAVEKIMKTRIKMVTLESKDVLGAPIEYSAFKKDNLQDEGLKHLDSATTFDAN